ILLLAGAQLALCPPPNLTKPTDEKGEQEVERNVDKIVFRQAKCVNRLGDKVVVSQARKYGCDDCRTQAAVPPRNSDREKQHRKLMPDAVPARQQTDPKRDRERNNRQSVAI